MSKQEQLFKGGTVDQAARKLAADVLDWEGQYGPTDPKTDACCEVDPEDFARWVALAREVVGR